MSDVVIGGIVWFVNTTGRVLCDKRMQLWLSPSLTKNFANHRTQSHHRHTRSKSRWTRASLASQIEACAKPFRGDGCAVVIFWLAATAPLALSRDCALVLSQSPSCKMWCCGWIPACFGQLVWKNWGSGRGTVGVLPKYCVARREDLQSFKPVCFECCQVALASDQIFWLFVRVQSTILPEMFQYFLLLFSLVAVDLHEFRKEIQRLCHPIRDENEIVSAIYKCIVFMGARSGWKKETYHPELYRPNFTVACLVSTRFIYRNVQLNCSLCW